MKTLPSFTISTSVYLPVEVEYVFWKGYAATQWEPGQEDEIEILSVKCDGHDILHAIPDRDLDGLKDECMEHVKKPADNF